MAELTEYEARQVAAIAAWKGRHEGRYLGLIERLTKPFAKLIEKLIPDRAAALAIRAAYRAALFSVDRHHERAAAKGKRRRAAESLEACDRHAITAGREAIGVAALQGAATGSGGVFTSLLDVPLLFGAAVRAIVETGRSYGYRLDGPKDEGLVLGVLVVALTNSTGRRGHHLTRIHEVEDLLVEEAEENILTEEFVSMAFHVEIFEDVPGVGAVSGGLLNAYYMGRVTRAARRVFQERWLRDREKLAAAIAATPAKTDARGTLRRVADAGIYSLSYGLTFPVALAASGLRGIATPVRRAA